ncbi:TPA: hypothetical protein DD449_04880 [Candidatus Berkelbacteria bacterium]|uniref:Uncharacterized protein n=1 Tax=Berkelbacteria bacterium GW2011_GWE1_39_12 TaxID=1618337 RepID=A0A0G4B369_9BACT|nr:MAG: hypothetical protein UT28_C0001G0595 [Berkelbacteria bacterium GW2011_GWE1_39_12]HBO60987.1 hypothetical protein [Candidatus Berkelbacteria bacterium]
MQIAFMIIIALLGAALAMSRRETRVSLGLLIVAVSFVLQIEGLASGFWLDALMALSLIVFAFGVYVLISRNEGKKNEKEDKIEPEKE